MSKARDLINAHLYPVLTTFSVVYGAIQIAPIANQARHYNTCVEGLIASFEKKGDKYNHHHIGYGRFLPEAICKGH
jgi:hypothetical protein